MSRIKPAVLVTAILVLLAGLALFPSCGSQGSFTGSRVKNTDAYLMDIENMNGTDRHTLNLQEGDVLRIRFETVKGALKMEIEAPDGTAIYCGNGEETTDFTVSIPESGVYTVVVEARHAKGTVHIQLAEQG